MVLNYRYIQKLALVAYPCLSSIFFPGIDHIFEFFVTMNVVKALCPQRKIMDYVNNALWQFLDPDAQHGNKKCAFAGFLN